MYVHLVQWGALCIVLPMAGSVAIPLGTLRSVFSNRLLSQSFGKSTAAKREVESSCSSKVRWESGVILAEQIVSGKPLRKAGPAEKQEGEAPHGLGLFGTGRAGFPPDCGSPHRLPPPARLEEQSHHPAADDFKRSSGAWRTCAAHHRQGPQPAPAPGPFNNNTFQCPLHKLGEPFSMK